MFGPLRRLLAVLLACPALAAAAPALAATGGTSAPATAPSVPMGQDGGVPYSANVPVPAKAKTVLPTVVSFSVGSSRFTNSKGLPLAFKLAGTTGPVHVRLHVYSRGKLKASLDLGQRDTGATQRFVVGSRAAAKLPAGGLVLKLVGADTQRHRLRANLQASAAHVVSVRSTPSPAPAPAPSGSGSHAFPLLGHSWSFAGPDGRFGAPRSGHIHQGQDVLAPSGTPIVAPAAGTVTFVAYQASGAGYYVVMREAGQSYWYAFMHLLAGSTAVHVGQTVRRGQLIGKVGATGDASGPHLHFEIWQGPWQAGGHPIDPLPYLQQWAAGS